MEDECATSSSVGTLRGVPLTLTITPPDPTDFARSHPASPHSSLPSPSSPSGDSVSSFPSVSSSFLFSSGPATPPQIDLDLTTHPPEVEGSHELIIPSLTLPSPIRRATPYGKTLGNVKLLVLSSTGSEPDGFLRVLADEQCEDYVDVGPWEDLDVDHHGQEGSLRHISISTDWIEHEDRHGSEKYEPSRNIDITHLPEYEAHDDVDLVIEAILERVHEPFQLTLSLLNSDQPPNSLLAHMIASSSSPLYTALVMLLPTSPTSLDYRIMSELSLHVPIIVFPHNAVDSRLSRKSSSTSLHLSSFRPESAHAFRTALLHHPEVLSSLRLEAVDRFLRWREIERGVESVLESGSAGGYPYPSVSASMQTPRRERFANSWQWDSPNSSALTSHHASSSIILRGKAKIVTPPGTLKWDKTRWESKWTSSLSTDVAKGLRQRKLGENTMRVHDSRTRKLLSRRPTVTAYANQRPPRPTPPESPTSSLTRRVSSPPSTVEKLPAMSEKGVSPTVSPSISLDPLHLPSLFAFTFSLLAPLKAKFFRFLPFASDASTSQFGNEGSDSSGFGIGIALGTFCVGFGLGYLAAGM